MAHQGCIQKFCQGGANLGYGKKRGGRKLTIVLCEAQGGGGGGGGATPYTCYAGMLVSLWHAKC